MCSPPTPSILIGSPAVFRTGHVSPQSPLHACARACTLPVPPGTPRQLRSDCDHTHRAQYGAKWAQIGLVCRRVPEPPFRFCPRHTRGHLRRPVQKCPGPPASSARTPASAQILYVKPCGTYIKSKAKHAAQVYEQGPGRWVGNEPVCPRKRRAWGDRSQARGQRSVHGAQGRHERYRHHYPTTRVTYLGRRFAWMARLKQLALLLDPTAALPCLHPLPSTISRRPLLARSNPCWH